MNRHASSRLALLLAGAVLLAGCNGDVTSNKHLVPIPSRVLALMEDKGMTKRDPILVRIFKEESTLEVWKRTNTGRYALLKEYEICRWSGTLGPKVREGDKQAPEGFYTVTPGQMNPKSSYHLSFNIGYPNAYDRAHGRTGSHLMVHGDCLSAGCYAVTDEQISELYAIGRESFAGGQREFQVHAYPFRMTPENMARRRDSKHFAFWQNLKEGYDHFEVTRQPPQVAVCDRRYVFNAQPAGMAQFNASAACPEYTVPDSIAMAVKAKQRQDAERFAELSQSVAVAEAYVPQNGRVRRRLGEPIVRVASAPVQPPAATAASNPATTSSIAAVSAAPVAAGAVPMPVPRPATFAAVPQPPRATGSRMFGWLRGSQEPETSAPPPPSVTPVSSASEAEPQPAPSGSRFGIGRWFGRNS